jgi:ubiquinone/menaquinone biosynthesis C-methylase UbiE
VLDVAGGTGLYAAVLPPSATYVCLDHDREKLSRLKSKRRAARVVQGDATRLSLRSKSIDAALCISVAHHLDDDELKTMFAELARVVRTRVVFLDPLRSPDSLMSELLWRLDAGSFPRSAPALLGQLSAAFDVEHTEYWAVYHRYVLCLARPRSAGPR